MSEIKVNKISPATGTETTLGDSSDDFLLPSGAEIIAQSGSTITIASGATLANAGTATGFGGGGKVLKTYSIQRTDNFSFTSASFIDVTGITLTVTPASTASKIMVTLNARMSVSAVGYAGWVQMLRDSTVIGSGTGTEGLSANSWASVYPFTDQARHGAWVGGTWMDEPSSTSALVYKLQAKMYNAAGTGVIGLAEAESSGYSGNYATSLIITELAAN